MSKLAKTRDPIDRLWLSPWEELKAEGDLLYQRMRDEEKFPREEERDLVALDALNEAVPQMDKNDERWIALEAELEPRAPISQKAEEEKRRRKARLAHKALARRNIWYRKDETGLGPADRYFAMERSITRWPEP